MRLQLVRMTAVAAAVAVIVGTQVPASGQTAYPPTPGADGAATAITGPASVAINTWTSYIVSFENHGTLRALIQVSLGGKGATRRMKAVVRPARYQMTLNGGAGPVDVQFLVRFRFAGAYTLTACATALRPREAHPADDCVSTAVTAA